MHDVVERFRANQTGFVRTYAAFLVLLILAAAADMSSTIHFMLVHGAQAEGHPFIRQVSIVMGPILGPVVGKVCQFVVVVALTVYLRRWAVHIFITVIVLYAWAAWYNTFGRHLYYPRILEILDHLAI